VSGGFALPEGSRVFWPISPRKPVTVGFCDLEYRQGIKDASGNFVLLPGYWHCGIDLNGPGAGDADLGQPIHAMAEGVVTYAGDLGGGSWGLGVVVFHERLGVWTRYAHCDRVTVRTGQTLEAGQVVGTIGKGKRGRFLAHLHFDVFYRPLPYPSWFPARFGKKTEVTAFCVDPVAFLEKFNAASTPRDDA
jgi:murein DD-endopeptidase MepM/ murein hydrolase activator NlpD